MSKSEFRMAPGQFFIWGITLVGLWAAFNAGNMIADEGYFSVFLGIFLVVFTLAVVTARRYWWIPVFVIGVLGFTTSGVGFKLEGTDMMTLFGFTCLIAMLSMGQLQSKESPSNLGIFFYLILIYVAFHSAIYGIDNYFNGDTQFKNIAKRYYASLIPLVLIWCMDRYAHPKGMQRSIHVMIVLSLIFSVIAIVVTLLELDIPIISGDIVNLSWAGFETTAGYLRWTILPILLLSLCLTTSTHSHGLRKFYQAAFLILFAANFFGGGRIALVMGLIFIAAWLVIRGKWQQFVFGGWVVFIISLVMLILGHTLDAKQLQQMPKSFQNVQRAFSIFLPSDQVNDNELMTEGSNQWHEDLAREAWDYTNEDFTTMTVGHGFKGWDDSIDFDMFTYGEAYESAVKIAVRMGSSETMLFSTLPIFGWIGVALYYGFMIELMRRNLRVRKLCPEGSLAKSLCEFSFCMIFTTLICSPVGGTIPSYNMIYWILGFIAADPYLPSKIQIKRFEPKNLMLAR